MVTDNYLLSPGDMGHAIGHKGMTTGCKVLTCLAGRSDCAKSAAWKLAYETEVEDTFVSNMDLSLSVLNPVLRFTVAGEGCDCVEKKHWSKISTSIAMPSPRTIARKVADIIENA